MTSFLLSIGYFLIFGILIYRWKFFQDKQISRHWVFSALGIKIIASILLTSLYTNYYTDRSTADIYKYFDDSLILFNALKDSPLDYIQMVLGLDITNTQYFNTTYYDHMLHWTRPFSNDLVSDSHIIIRLNAFFRLFSFGEIMVHNIFINFISLSGLWLLYKHFKKWAFGKEKLLFITTIVLPSVLFWGSGLLKEGILLFALGLCIGSYYQLIQSIRWQHLVSFLFGLMLLVFTKFYLVVVLFIPFGGLLLSSWIKKDPWVGFVLATLLFVVSFSILPYLHHELNIVNQIAMKQQSFSNFIAEVPANSGFAIPQLTDAWSILKHIPNSLVNTLIRPYPWECSSLFVLLSCLENGLVVAGILLTLVYRSKLSRAQREVVLFNLFFVLGLYILIGLTTPVFGAIVRYKIPGLLILFITLVIVLDKNRCKAKFKWLQKFD